MNYKDTLFIPKTNFEMKANLNQKEEIFQSWWNQINLYQKVLAKNSSNPVFFLHDGPPYANGNIHVGHALNKTLKDIIVRYKNFAGFNAPFIPGWDTHGLPIELAMLKTQKNINECTPIEIRKKCKEYALKQIEIQKSQFKRIGLLTDFSKIYRTLDHDFEIQQLKLFLEMIKKNLIFRDLKPVFWSWSSQSALAEAEIEYADVTSDSILVSFKAINKNWDENTYFVIWTTTPWTIPTNLAIAVKPSAKYVLVECQNKNYVIAKDLLSNFLQKINLNINQVKILNEYNGSELENIKYIHPLIKNKELKIILADYVSLEDGTGLVHNSPGFGIDDYLACKKYNIKPFTPIDNYGNFTDEIEIEELKNVFYLDSNEMIINWLNQNNALLFHQKITHSDAHDWRTKKPVIRRATKQWFVNLKTIQNQIITCLKEDVNSPDQRATDRMIEMISKRVEWCISRQRVWGVPIPMILDENDNPIYDIELIENIINIIDQNGTNVWFEWETEKFLTPKYLNDQHKYKKEKDIMDVWFDSGSSHMMINVWGYNYPSDLYLEGSDQYRGWFNSSLITGVIYNNKPPYKALLQHGFTLDENGFKMSKSLGNVVDPLKVFDTYGADIFRLFVASTEYNDDQRFGESILRQISEIYRRIRNTLLKYSLSMINDFDYDNHATTNFEIEDKYILNKLHNLLVYIDQKYQEYNFSSIVKSINEFALDLSGWYFDIIKDPMYCDSLTNPRRIQIQTTIYYIVKNITIALAPIIPHTAEEAYKFINNKKYESVHLEDWINLNKFCEFNQENEFNNFFKLKDQIFKLLENLRSQKIIKKNNEVEIILKSNPTNFSVEQLKKFLNVATVKIDQTSDELIQIIATKNIMCQRCWNYYENNQMHNHEICNRCYKVINNK